MQQPLIGVIDYGMGNIRSVVNSLRYLGSDIKVVVTHEAIDRVSHLILPGVGAFPKAMENLKAQGLIEAIHRHVQKRKPFLGICLGMQLLADEGEEIARTQGLGIIPGRVSRLDVSLHIPHVGWNNIMVQQKHPVFEGFKKEVDFYFVHSYFLNPTDPKNIIATAKYEKVFPCVVTNGASAVATQFHPEKSQDNGLKILENFCAWDGRC